MDEWTQDLASALEDSSLKQETDDQGDLSASSLRIDRDNCRKRRMRKRRTASTNAHLVSNLISNLVVVNQISKSPRSSSSIDEVVKDYYESFTANFSDESDECANSWKSRLKNAVLSSRLRDRGHHKRVFKQARPCYCESDSHAENIPVIPRRHRKKKLKRMTVDSENVCQLQDSQGPTSGSCDEAKKRKQPKKNVPHPSAGNLNREKMYCESAKAKKDRKTMIACLMCYKKDCDKLPVRNNGNSMVHENTIENRESNSKEDYMVSCQCNCHTNLGKDESSISGSSCNSDTDSANFTPDDLGGDGDDEMTDFYAESDGGPVLGVPHFYGLPWLKPQGMQNSKDEAMWCFKMNGLDIGNSPYAADPRMKQFVPGTVQLSEPFKRGLNSRRSRLAAVGSRSRRARRRAKVKKAKEKSLREQDLHSLNKLSLSARSKRMKLEGFKEFSNNRQDYMPPKSFCPVSSPQLTFTNYFQDNGQEDDMDMLDNDTVIADDASPTAR